MNTATVMAIVGVLGPTAAFAERITYDFAGTGRICTFTGASNNQACVDDQAATGTVTIDVLAVSPNGPDAFLDANRAQDLDSWVRADFVIQWNGISFNPGQVSEPNVAAVAPAGEVLLAEYTTDVSDDDELSSWISGVSLERVMTGDCRPRAGV